MKLWYDPDGDFMELIFEKKGATSARRRMNG
ncbi:hypothetical protein BH23ACT11_BH23ACT11_15830 [soil metagenome]